MDGKQGVEIRDSITKAIDNFISYNEKTYSYDKTYIGRIILVNSDGTYNVQINRAKYYNLKSENGFIYTKNDIVKCIAPQNNLNLLYIASGTKNQNDINQNIFGVKNFINGIQLNGLQINGLEASNIDLNTIIQAGFYGIANGVNTPNNVNYGELIVFGYRTLNNWVAQLFIVQGDDALEPNYAYLRSSTSVDGGTWSEWKLLSFADATNANIPSWINALLKGQDGYGDKIISHSFGDRNGYIKYASGLIIQWGRRQNQNNTPVNLNISFSNTNYIFTVAQEAYQSGNVTRPVPVPYSASQYNCLATSSCGWWTWIAIGY